MRRTKLGVTEDVTTIMRDGRGFAMRAAQVLAEAAANTAANVPRPKSIAATFGNLPIAVVADVTKGFALDAVFWQSVPHLYYPNHP